jgi:hypothetical protein
MKITFPALLAIVGLLTHSQSIAIAQEQESSAQNRESLVPEGAHTTDPAVSIAAQRTNDLESAERVALDEVTDAVQADPLNAPDIVAHSVKTDVPRPIPMSCEIVRAAIRALGKRATRVLVARIVYAAVREQPNEVLYIVCVAIQETTDPFHQHIVHAAIAALPDPNARVSQASLKTESCGCPSRAEPYEGISLPGAIYEEALLAAATAYELDYYPVLGVTGIANDDAINKNPPPTPPPVSP